MKGKFYAVGVGPGDPDLITLKAIKTIENCEIVAAPRSGASINIALQIAEDYIGNKEVMEFDMPMIKDKEKLDLYHDKCAEKIGELLDGGKSVAFLTLGDPAIYSTVMYVHKRLTVKGYDTAMVPGITSFCGAAASLNQSLCERDEQLHIIPATYKEKICNQLSGTKVLMKSGRQIMEVKDKLAGEKAMMVERATMDDEVVYHNLNDLKEKSGYFSLIVVPSKERQKEI